MPIGRTLAAIAVLSLAGACGSPQRAARPSAAADAAELRRITQEMMDAVAPGHAEVWRRYLDERLVYVDENGATHDKAEVLRELTPLPPGLVGRIEVDVFRAEIHGDVAVVAFEVQEHLDYHGQPLRGRFRTAGIRATITCTDGGLLAERPGRPAVRYLPEVADVFFVAGQPRTRRIFLRDDRGQLIGFVDRREGEDVRWRKIPSGS